MNEKTILEKLQKRVPLFIIIIYNYAASACNITSTDNLGSDLDYFGTLYFSLCGVNMLIDCWYAYRAYTDKYALRYLGLIIFCSVSLCQAIPMFILVTNLPSLNTPLKVLFGYNDFESIVITSILMSWMYLLLIVEEFYLSNVMTEYEKIILDDSNSLKN